MLAKYRDTAADLGLDESRMLAVQGDLLAPTVEPTRPPLRDEDLQGFDLVAISMALHHIEDIQLATRRLAERLRPGGVLLIVDGATRESKEQMDPPAIHHHGQGQEQRLEHPTAHTISHDSFSQPQIFSLFDQAGCGDSQFVLADRLSHVPGARTGQMQLFWARASKQ